MKKTNKRFEMTNITKTATATAKTITVSINGKAHTIKLPFTPVEPIVFLIEFDYQETGEPAEICHEIWIANMYPEKDTIIDEIDGKLELPPYHKFDFVIYDPEFREITEKKIDKWAIDYSIMNKSDTAMGFGGYTPLEIIKICERITLLRH